jgi:hypothetical protein
MPLPNPSMSFTPLDPLPASDLNDLVQNIESLADGTGFDAGVIGTLGYAQITSNATATSLAAVSGLSTTVTIPAGGRRTKITVYCQKMYNTSGPSNTRLTLWDGTVGSGTQLTAAEFTSGSANYGAPITLTWSGVPSAGSKTYNVGLTAVGGTTATLEAASTYPAFILVEII